MSAAAAARGDRAVRQTAGRRTARGQRQLGGEGRPPTAREVGYDAVFDYHDGPAADLLGKAAPGGIDVFVDNVGGAQLATAVERCGVGRTG